MYVWFWICVVLIFIAIPLHFISVEHTKLQKKYGKEKGIRIGKIYGTVSGTMQFLILIGLWVSPQPHFTIPLFLTWIISVPLILIGSWIAIEGVRTLSLKAAETHYAEKLVTTGIYSKVRHPMHFGWILAHMGMCFIFSALYALLFTPFLLILLYMISKKEEQELVKEFGKEYKNYQKKVPMLIPKLK